MCEERRDGQSRRCASTGAPMVPGSARGATRCGLPRMREAWRESSAQHDGDYAEARRDRGLCECARHVAMEGYCECARHGAKHGYCDYASYGAARLARSMDGTGRRSLITATKLTANARGIAQWPGRARRRFLRDCERRPMRLRACEVRRDGGRCKRARHGATRATASAQGAAHGGKGG